MKRNYPIMDMMERVSNAHHLKMKDSCHILNKSLIEFE